MTDGRKNQDDLQRKQMTRGIEMTYREIFREIYHDNRRFIRTYVILCLVISMLAFGGVSRVQAGDTPAAQEMLSSEEMLSSVGGSFGKMAVLFPCVQSFLSDIDQPTVMVLVSAIPFALDHFPGQVAFLGDQMGIEDLEKNLDSYSFGLFENDVFKIICLLWFVLAKSAKSNRFTCTTGLILENKAAQIGGAINAITVVSQFLANIPAADTVYAASDTVRPAGYVNYFGALICFVSLMLLAVIYLFVRMLFRFISIVLHPIYLFVPFSSLAGTMGKFAGVGVLLLTAALHPAVFAVIAVLILAVSVVLFRNAYISVRYFKNIYVKPFFRKFRGYDSEIPLVSPKLPEKLKAYLNHADVEMAIPVYFVKRVKALGYVHKHDRWWLVSSQHKNGIYKPRFGQRGCYCIELDNTAERKVFLRKSLRFFEVFDLSENEKADSALRKGHKNLHLVFSKEYFHRYERIKEITTFTDFAEYKNQVKQDEKMSKQEIRRQKRAERGRRPFARS